jgi:hypothetical protein
MDNLSPSLPPGNPSPPLPPSIPSQPGVPQSVGPQPASRLPRWRDEAYSALLRLDVLGCALRLEKPWVLLVVGLVIGLALAAWSYRLGIASFSAEVAFLDGSFKEVVVRTIKLGYMNHLHYGLYYIVLCPLLLFLIANAADITNNVPMPSDERATFSVPSLLRRWNVALVGVLLLVGFVYKDISVEFGPHGDYFELGLGFVQAEELQRLHNQMEAQSLQGQTAPQTLRKRLFKLRTGAGYEEAHFVRINQVKNLQLPDTAHDEFIAFVLAVKTWVGICEALMTYASVVFALWAIQVIRRFWGAQEPKSAFDQLSWTQPVVASLFMAGVLLNVWYLLRVQTNLYKGTFSSVDQLFSVLTLTPACVGLMLGGTVLFQWLRKLSSDDPTTAQWSKLMLGAALAWGSLLVVITLKALSVMQPELYADIIEMSQHIRTLFA